MKRFAVIGNPIAHSLSPIIHQRFGEQTHIALTYEKILGGDYLFEQQVGDFFNEGGKGINVTLPFKQKAFALAQQTTSRCALAGAANALWLSDGILHADNTDGAGLLRDLDHYLQLPKKEILILGSGGAARGIIHPLMNQNPANLVVASRSEEKAKEFQNDFPQVNCIKLAQLSGTFDLIINATSAGLTGDFVALPKEMMINKPFCYDLAYSIQTDTAFVNYAKAQQCAATDGLGMLVEQAAEAFYLWNGILPTTQNLLKQLRAGKSF